MHAHAYVCYNVILLDSPTSRLIDLDVIPVPVRYCDTVELTVATQVYWPPLASSIVIALEYVVKFIIIAYVVLNIVPFGPVHTVVTVT